VCKILFGVQVSAAAFAQNLKKTTLIDMISSSILIYHTVTVLTYQTVLTRALVSWIDFLIHRMACRQWNSCYIVLFFVRKICPIPEYACLEFVFDCVYFEGSYGWRSELFFEVYGRSLSQRN
jgi:hypothetical protein